MIKLLFVSLCLLTFTTYSQINLGPIKSSRLSTYSELYIAAYALKNCQNHIDEIFYIVPKKDCFAALININNADIQFKTQSIKSKKRDENPLDHNADDEEGYILYDKNGNKIFYKYIDRTEKIYLKIWYEKKIREYTLCASNIGD